jgi:hypothetical protein
MAQAERAAAAHPRLVSSNPSEDLAPIDPPPSGIRVAAAYLELSLVALFFVAAHAGRLCTSIAHAFQHSS